MARHITIRKAAEAIGPVRVQVDFVAGGSPSLWRDRALGIGVVGAVVHDKILLHQSAEASAMIASRKERPELQKLRQRHVVRQPNSRLHEEEPVRVHPKTLG